MVRSSSVSAKGYDGDIGPSKSLKEPDHHSNRSFSTFARKWPSRVYHSINWPICGTTLSLRCFRDRCEIGRGHGRICPLCDKDCEWPKTTVKSAREWNEFMNRSKFETLQECRSQSASVVTERERGPRVISECSFVRSKRSRSRHLRFANLDNAKSADIGPDPQNTLMVFVDDNDSLELFLSMC